MDIEQLTGIPPEIDIRTMGFGPERPMTQSENGEDFAGEDGFSTIHIPPDLFDADVRHLAVRIVRAVYRMEPARNPLMRAVYRMLSRLADERTSATPAALAVGLLLGAAKVHGVRIGTHPRDLAKEIGTRYAILLAIRRAAVTEFERLGPDDWCFRIED